MRKKLYVCFTIGSSHLLFQLRTIKGYLLAPCIILCAVLLRLFFIGHHWPLTDSEEGTMGLEALHILERGEHPIYLYGQHYMGVAEAYLGALMFRLYGVSVSSLRLGMLLFYAVFLVLFYLLARLLYRRRTALLALILLAGGPTILITEELKAVGGAIETLVCGTAMLLLASTIALSGDVATPSAACTELVITPAIRARRRLWMLYLAWGCVAGLGLWIHTLTVPFMVASALLLGLCCLRALRERYWLPLGLGFLIGAAPLIIYDFLDPANNNLVVFWRLHATFYPDAPTGLLLWLKQSIGTFFYTLPLSTGIVRLEDLHAITVFSTLFTRDELHSLPFYADQGWSWLSLFTLVVYGGWSLVYMVVLVRSTVLTLAVLARRQRLYAFWQAWRRHIWSGRKEEQVLTPLEQRQRCLSLARGMLLLVAWLTLLSYLSSATAAQRPWSFRYLIGLLVVTPAIIDPLVRWSTRQTQRFGSRWIMRWQRPLARLVLCGILLTSMLATAQNFFALPQAYADVDEHAALVHSLEQQGINRVYSGYWVCDRLIFTSHEHIICAVLGEDMLPGLTRYQPYKGMVDSVPHSAYLFTTDGLFHPKQAIADFTRDTHYTHIQVGRYLIFYAAGHKKTQ